MNTKVKVLFIINDLGLGGVERLTTSWAEAMDKSIFKVYVATIFSRTNSFFKKEDFGPNVSFIDLSFKNWRDLPKWLQLYKLIKKEKIDVVFTQLFMADFIGRIAAFVAGVPVIATAIQNIIPSLKKRYILTDRLLSHITDICISPTSATNEYAKKIVGFPIHKIHDIPTNSVDEKRFLNLTLNKTEFRKNLGIPVDAKVIITVGRLIGQKGHGILLEAVPKIIKEEKDAYFIIVGDGPLESKLKEKAHNLGIDNKVLFTGRRADTPQLFKASDIFVFPSLWEGQGVILFEAFFSKIPIVASNIGGIPDVVLHEKTGILVEPGNVTDLVNKLIFAIQNPTEMERLANNAYEKYKDRTFKNSIKKMGDLFLSVLNKKHKFD